MKKPVFVLLAGLILSSATSVSAAAPADVASLCQKSYVLNEKIVLEAFANPAMNAFREFLETESVAEVAAYKQAVSNQANWISVSNQMGKLTSEISQLGKNQPAGWLALAQTKQTQVDKLAVATPPPTSEGDRIERFQKDFVQFMKPLPGFNNVEAGYHGVMFENEAIKIIADAQGYRLGLVMSLGVTDGNFTETFEIRQIGMSGIYGRPMAHTLSDVVALATSPLCAKQVKPDTRLDKPLDITLN